MERVSGKYGRRRDKLSLNRPHLHLGDYLTGAVPAHPASVDYLNSLSNWQMLGNDTYGDCVAVTWANTRRLVSAYLATENYPSWPEVETVYKTQNPNFPSEDNGMDIQTLLGWLTKNTPPDGVKALGFASVDHTNVAEVQAAIALFGSVWTGIIVDNNNEIEFNNNQPWDYNPNSAQAGGHSIITGGYGASEGGKLSGDEKFITWAQETSFTDAFWSNQVEEAWVVIWPEHMGSKEFQAGVDLNALAADYQALTGKVFPAPVPAPPVDTPTAADNALQAVAGPWAAAFRSRPDLVTLQSAIKAWETAKGF